MSLAEAIVELQSAAGGLSGVKAAPNSPPEGAHMFPFAVSYVRSGSMEGVSAGMVKGLHVIYTEIHVSRTLLGSAMTQALGYVEAFGEAVWNDPTLDGKVDGVTGLDYEFGWMEYGGVKTLGVRFSTRVKIIGTI